MELRKWNYSKNKYELVVVPDGMYLAYHYDMDFEVNCPHCQKKLKMRETYCSKVFHTLPFGFGLGVCKECYEKELQEFESWRY